MSGEQMSAGERLLSGGERRHFEGTGEQMTSSQKIRRVDRGFWILFVGGWTVYGGLVVSTSVIENQSPASGLASVIAPAVFATLVAMRRRSLLNPEWSFFKTLGIHLGVGVAFAVVSGLGTAGLMLAFGLQDPAAFGGDPRYVAVAYSFYYLLLYTILAGFMMWTESLKRVQETRDLLAKEAVLRAEAEAKAVRAQFNPHFVFNTLHSLILLVRADPGAAERAIEDVAALIRYASNLDRRNVDAVPLGQELEIAKRYMGLESLRLSHRMRIDWEIDEELEAVPVPPFSLQILLENAIKHGIAPKEEGGSIRVRIKREREDLVISVEDDGLGATPELVRAAEGKGLNLLQRRLSTLFGDAAALTWQTAAGKGFSVLLRVPLPRPPEPTPDDPDSTRTFRDAPR